jgi:hypothetical protein
MPKRNRKQRYDADVYRLEHLLKDGTPCPVSEEQNHFIEGGIDGVMVLSVPTNTPAKVAANVQEMVSKKFNQDVLIVTHNIGFLKATKISPKEAAELVKMAQEPEEGETAH